MSEWPFEEPKNLAVISLVPIVKGGAPILHVVHDADDGGWQFLGWSDAEPADAAVVSLQRIVETDPSVTLLAYLPEGWHAWRRSLDEPWQRGPL
jgi:hypothetical protein